MRIQALTISLLLAGCLGAESQAPAGEPAAALPAAPQASSGLASPSAASAPAPPDTLSAALRARCDSLLPTAPDRPLAVVGRTEAGSGELLRVAWAEPSDSLGPTVPETKVLHVQADACVDPYRASEPAPWAALRALHASPTINDRIVAVEVEAEGGVEAVQREIDASRETSFAIRECWPGEAFAEAACTRPELAAAYRRAGLRIEGPEDLSPVLTAADLSAVPDSLRGCVPPRARAEEGEVEHIGALADGPQLDHLFVVYPKGWVTYEGEYHVHAASQTPDGECAGAGSWREVGPLLLRLAGSPDIQRQWARTEVARAGSAEGYVRAYRENTRTDGPYVCPEPGESGAGAGHCVSGAFASELRALGVPVRPASDIP